MLTNVISNHTQHEPMEQGISLFPLPFHITHSMLRKGKTSGQLHLNSCMISKN